jgi:hypothetical protein
MASSPTLPVHGPLTIAGPARVRKSEPRNTGALIDSIRRQVPECVWEPARRESLDRHLLEALSLIGELCPSLNRLEASFLSSAESDERWIDLRVHVRGGVDECLIALDDFSSHWSEVAPWEAQDGIRVVFVPASHDG